ncbi:hypothetical protein AB9P05_22630 [Roseivirga sp. BDSF3-8]
MKKQRIKLNDLKVASFLTNVKKDIKGGRVDSWQGHSQCDGCHISH